MRNHTAAINSQSDDSRLAGHIAVHQPICTTAHHALIDIDQIGLVKVAFYDQVSQNVAVKENMKVFTHSLCA
jgi:hypothetical protein